MWNLTNKIESRHIANRMTAVKEEGSEGLGETGKGINQETELTAQATVHWLSEGEGVGRWNGIKGDKWWWKETGLRVASRQCMCRWHVVECTLQTYILLLTNVSPISPITKINAFKRYTSIKKSWTMIFSEVYGIRCIWAFVGLVFVFLNWFCHFVWYWGEILWPGLTSSSLSRS